jgi:hypothetical protein
LGIDLQTLKYTGPFMMRATDHITEIVDMEVYNLSKADLLRLRPIIIKKTKLLETVALYNYAIYHSRISKMSLVESLWPKLKSN